MAALPRIVDTVHHRRGTVLEADETGMSVQWRPGYVEWIPAAKIDTARFVMVAPAPRPKLPSWLREVEPDRWSISDRD